ncbi:putative exported protein [Candidatus Rhodobacter oscarellae]|uniref:Putative exported protein n=1 Tax=Candidatus Rhodobacter oscarellae TaxID=1675527 RepID=A0A0J9EDB9_9RHOB|nr:3-keto-5-aminohexanoate cleavage protein [Candidatus Rhodobacter lobularis]KMW60661.1 putative exported protein [Candidatus Rhodobacter lobularis]
MSPLIMVAPTGARRTKADHPGIPLTIAETVETAIACQAAGAQAFHLHVRNADGSHSIDPGLYREAIAELGSAAPDLRVQVTTESGGVFGVEAQLATLSQLRPAWCTLALREAARDRDIARRMYRFVADQGVELQHIIFDAGDAALLAEWQREGVLGGAESVILVLGRYTADMNSNPDDLEPLLAALPPVGRWMLCAFGPQEHACLTKAARLGGDVRVGFENSFLQPDGAPWPDMAASITALRNAIGSAI